MEVVTGATGSLLLKLGQLLMEEYNLHKSVKRDIQVLQRELESMHAALLKVGEVPLEELDCQLKLWAGEVRELSYTMEDIVDKSLVHFLQGPDQEATGNSHTLIGFLDKMGSYFRKCKTHHQITNAIKKINNDIQEVADRRGRYAVVNIVPAPVPTVDPRIWALYTDMAQLVGIDGKRDQVLINLLSLDVAEAKLKTVSIVGCGGLGKTTLARAVYDKIKVKFDSCAFVRVGPHPNTKKIFRDIHIDVVNKKKCTNANLTVLDETQLIEELKAFLEEKRYLIIIDDIWEEKLWKYIKLVFSNMGDRSSRLITTTRIVSVSKACGPFTYDSVYEMKPLSTDDSLSLFHKRIFLTTNGCPNELEQVSSDILNRCGGVPLAIITIASLLASGQPFKPKHEWHSLLHSMGRGLAEDESLENMRRILSISYYDLPSHLKTCLLYLCIYPADWEIEKDQLIRKWIAESFVVCGKQGTDIFKLGETYFNELINRSLIQPIYNSRTGEVEACCVHDMVLDLICSLSREANFVNFLDGTWYNSPQSIVRRLSLQNINEDPKVRPPINFMSNLSQVRSITVFPPAINIVPALSRLHVLRVLDMTGCNLGQSNHQLNLKDVEYLLHLRYLGLAETGICGLPSEIGNLQFLEVLDVGGNDLLEELPSTICKLKRLMFLHFNSDCKIAPDVLGKLISMEVLKTVVASLHMVQELWNITELRELEISFRDGSLDLAERFVESLCNLQKIESLVVDSGHETSHGLMDLLGERWVPPRQLRKFVSYIYRKLSVMPAWINAYPSHLLNLSELSLYVTEVQQEDMQNLGRLPTLGCLCIRSTGPTQRQLLIDASGFRCMKDFTLWCMSGAQIVFERGALPRAVDVTFTLDVQVAIDDGNFDFDVGLLSLRLASVIILSGGVSVGEARDSEAALKRALRLHPNHPIICITMWPAISEDAHDDDLISED